MARIISTILLLWLALPLSLFAGEIKAINVGKESLNEIEIIIEGDYGSYQAIGLRSPARFAIDLEGARLMKGLPQSIDVKGAVVSAIKAGRRGTRLSIVLYSANEAELFHSTIQDKKGRLLIKCWKSNEIKSSAPDSGPWPGPAASPVLPEKDLGELFGWTEEIEDKQEKGQTKEVVRFTGNKITVTFFKEGLHNVFQIFATPGLIDRDISIMVDEKVEGEVTLALNQVPWDLVLNIILEENGLVMEEKAESIFIVKNKPEKPKGQKGELVVRKYSEEILQPARLLKQKKENRQKAQDLIFRAHNLETRARPEESLTLYEKAFELWKDNLVLVKKMAYLHYTLGNFARSYYFAGEALRINNKDAEGALYAALSAAGMKKNDEARLLFEAGMEGRPKIPEVFFNYGLFLEKRKDYGRAGSIFRKYERLFGPSLDVSLAIARLYEAQKMTGDACKRYKVIQYSGFSMDKKLETAVQNKVLTLCGRGEN
ncbi:MAG: hypothetical protein GY864_02795 [Desulfobacterales bacterium]|nr:hypothetical protein [Desulfobacterales bacterium]